MRRIPEDVWSLALELVAGCLDVRGREVERRARLLAQDLWADRERICHVLKPGLQESEAEQGWEAKTLWEDPPTGISQSTGDAVRFARTSPRGKADPCGEFIPTPSVQVRIDRPLRVSDLDRLRSEVNARLGYRSRGAQERRCLKHIVEQELGLEERDSRKGSWEKVDERWVGHGQESKNWQAHMMCYRRLKGLA